MTSRRIVAVVPMKPLSRSKTRLASVLSERERADLSLAMFSKVVRAAHEALGTVWVVGGDSVVRQTADRLGVKWLEDPGNDLNESLSFALSKACRVGKAAIYLPADLPFVAAADIEKIVQASVGGETLALSPAQQDGGTNAMLIPKCLRFPPLLGKDSYARHKQQAASLGIPYTVCLSEGLALDLDTPDDIALCDRLQPGFLSTIMPAAASSTQKGEKKD